MHRRRIRARRSFRPGRKRTDTSRAARRDEVTRLVPIRPENHEVRRADFFDLSRRRGCSDARRHLLHLENGSVKAADTDLRGDFLGRFRASTRALAASGCAITIGAPISDCVRIARSSGTSPRNGIPSSSAARFPPPWPKMWSLELQCGQNVIAHVLDDSEDRNSRLLEHAQRLHRNAKPDVLRRGNDHRAGQRHVLGQRQMNVAGPRRKIDDQIVQFAPIHIEQALLQARCAIGPRQISG